MSESEKAPRCRLCGHAHWSNEPHNWKVAAPPAPKKKKAPGPRNRPKVRDQHDACKPREKKSSASLGSTQPPKKKAALVHVHKGNVVEEVSKIDSGLSDAARRKAEWRRKNPEKYRAYQRKYMAQRRAAKKGK